MLGGEKIPTIVVTKSILLDLSEIGDFHAL